MQPAERYQEFLHQSSINTIFLKSHNLLTMAEFTACVKKALFHSINLWIKPCPHWEQHTTTIVLKQDPSFWDFLNWFPLFTRTNKEQPCSNFRSLCERQLYQGLLQLFARQHRSLCPFKTWPKPVVELSTFWKTQQDTSTAIPANPSGEASYKGCYFGSKDTLPPQW